MMILNSCYCSGKYIRRAMLQLLNITVLQFILLDGCELSVLSQLTHNLLGKFGGTLSYLFAASRFYLNATALKQGNDNGEFSIPGFVTGLRLNHGEVILLY